MSHSIYQGLTVLIMVGKKTITDKIVTILTGRGLRLIHMLTYLTCRTKADLKDSKNIVYCDMSSRYWYFV